MLKIRNVYNLDSFTAVFLITRYDCQRTDKMISRVKIDWTWIA